ncbi:MAG: MarR family winged helix-turn-helix transcriptional regulator [Solirubrobacterales bacterium]
MDPRLGPTGALLEAHVALDEALEKHAQGRAGLDNYTADLLVRLMRAPGKRLRGVDVTQGLMISSSSTTRLIDRAEAAGLVKRQPDPDDRRAQQIVLTNEGERAAREFAPFLLAVLQRVVFDNFSREELSVLTQLLVRLRDAARHVDAEDEPPTEDVTSGG